MKRLWPAAVFGVMVVLFSAVGLWVEGQTRQQAEAVARAEVRSTIDGLRLRLETRIQANMQIAEGLASYVAAHPQLTPADFSGLAESLMRHRSEVSHIGLARGTTIVAVSPLQGNEAVIGVDYRDIPEQWAAARFVRDQGRPLMAGPVALIQGGRAVIGRVPVFTRGSWWSGDGGGGPGSGTESGSKSGSESGPDVSPASGPPVDDEGFWGIVSVPIDLDALFDHVGLTGTHGLELAIRGVDGRGADGAVFHGTAETFVLRDPVQVNVALPGGSWQMAAVPQQGWPSEARWPGGVFAAFLVGGLVLGGAGGLGAARLIEEPPQPEVRHGPRALIRHEDFVALVDAEVLDRRAHGRTLSVLGLELPADVAGRLSTESCLAACAAAVRPEDAVGCLAVGRYAIVLGGAAGDGASLAAGFVRRALGALVPEAAEARYASVSLSPEDADGEAVLARLEALLDEVRHQPGGGLGDRRGG